MMFFFFFKQKTAYEMRISDWSSDVCSSDLAVCVQVEFAAANGVLNTREGAVSYREGDAIMTGPSGERWPISRSRFDATYEPATAAEGAGWYCKRPLVVDARQAIKEERVLLRRGAGEIGRAHV